MRQPRRDRVIRIARPVLLVTALVTVVWVSAGDLNPPPGAIQPTNRVQLNEQVISLPYTISQPGSYVLTSGLMGVAGQDGIIIDADDVTLDLNGFPLVGVAGSLDGVRVSGARRNVTVVNGIVAAWDGNGINAASAIGGRFETLSISDSGLDGLFIGSDGSVRALSISGSAAAGIHVGGVRNRIEANHVTTNGTGIDVDGTDNLIVKNNASGNATDYDIVVGNAYGSIVAVGGAGDISFVPKADHPWANFSHACTQQIWCADLDGDGYGDAGSTVTACTPPVLYVADCTDCDDSNPLTFPGAAEICDFLDNDCDGPADEGAGTTWCDDLDGDGYGNAASTVVSCDQPPGFVTDCTDCNDMDPGISPAATEVCGDSIDNDCDGTADNGCGGCATSNDCGAGELCCFGICINADTDVDHCGSCGSTCPTGGSCAAGACSCPSGTIDCGGSCVDLLSDASHCGGCGSSCGGGPTCCNGACTDTQNDESNCGACGSSCSAGSSCCSGSCLDTQSDESNCGACGTLCAAGSTCCGGGCVDTQSDDSNCGACGTLCAGGLTCSSGQCCLNAGAACATSSACCSANCSPTSGTCQ